MRLVHIIAVACLGWTVLAAGCWDDDCAEPCREGYACYYGICLSSQFCSASDPNIQPDNPCLQTDPETRECIERSQYAICQEGYSCECTALDSGGRCTQRTCVDIDTLSR